MTTFLRNETASNKDFIHVYSGISKDDLDKKIDKLFLSSGYTLKEGQPGDATYVKGDRILRILFGAFVQYFKFNVVTTQYADEVKLEVTKSTSGMSGGVIGVNQVKKELRQLEQLFQTI